MRTYASLSLIALTLSGCMATAPKTVEIDNKAPVKLARFGSAPPNTYDGVDFRTQLQNFSGKAIKYVYLTVYAQNAVGDKAADRLGRSQERILEVVGPIEHGDMPSHVGAYKSIAFASVWYNSTIACAGINNVEIIYMDNTKQSFSGEALKPLLLGRGCSEF